MKKFRNVSKRNLVSFRSVFFSIVKFRFASFQPSEICFEHFGYHTKVKQSQFSSCNCRAFLINADVKKYLIRRPSWQMANFTNV